MAETPYSDHPMTHVLYNPLSLSVDETCDLLLNKQNMEKVMDCKFPDVDRLLSICIYLISSVSTGT